MRKLNILLLALTFLLITGAWIAHAAPPLPICDPQSSTYEPPPDPPESDGADQFGGLTGDPDDIIEGNRRNSSAGTFGGGLPTGSGTEGDAPQTVSELLLLLALQWFLIGG